MTPSALPNIPKGKRFHAIVSPSQVDTYKKCPRRWYNASVLFDRQPQPPFMLKGDAIHKALEHYGKTGEVLTAVSLPDPLKNGELTETSTFAFVQAAIPYLAPPVTDEEYWAPYKGKGPNGTNSAGLLLEQLADLATWSDGNGVCGPEWKQFIDRVEAYPDHAKIIDFKTTSSFRYAKKPAELKQNTQLMANARWLFMNSDYKEIEIGLLYLLTATKTPKPMFVSVVVTREEVEALWAEDMEIVKEMVVWSAMESPTADVLPPNTSSCGDYGGCYYREKCGFDKTGTPAKPAGLFGAGAAVTPALIPATSLTRRSDMGNPFAAKTAAPGNAPSTPAAPKATAPTASAAPAPAPTPKPVVAAASAAKSSPFAKPAATAPAPAPAASAPPASAPAAVKAAPTPAPAPAASAPAAPAKKPGLLATLMAKKAEAPAAPATPPPAAFNPDALGISPPDAAPSTSTPEEVAAANPEPEPEATTETAAESAVETSAPAVVEVAQRPPGRRGRPPGSKNKKTEEFIAAAANTAAPEAPPAEEVAPIAAITAGASVVEEATTEAEPETATAAASPTNLALDTIRERLRNGDPMFGCGVRFLFVDCLPGKGWTGETPTDLDEVMHAFQAEAAAAAKAPDYRLIRYEQKGYLCMAIKVMMKGLPASVYVNTRTPGAAEFLAEVTPYAEMVFRGTR